MWAVVGATFLTAVLCGIKARKLNATAGALVTTWALAQAIWLHTGDNLPLRFYMMADIAVVTAIYAKTIARCGPKTYWSLSHQLRCLITDLTVWDRWILGIYALAVWPAYILEADPYLQWHWLWSAAISQFVLAGTESFTLWRESMGPKASPRAGSGSLRLALGGMRHGR